MMKRIIIAYVLIPLDMQLLICFNVYRFKQLSTEISKREGKEIIDLQIQVYKSYLSQLLKIFLCASENIPQ
jgi:hypothetical protein